MTAGQKYSIFILWRTNQARIRYKIFLDSFLKSAVVAAGWTDFNYCVICDFPFFTCFWFFTQSNPWSLFEKKNILILLRAYFLFSIIQFFLPIGRSIVFKEEPTIHEINLSMYIRKMLIIGQLYFIWRFPTNRYKSRLFLTLSNFQLK